MTPEFRERARRLRNAVEPVAAGVYFAPEAHAAYQALGFDGSSASADGVAHPELKSYFTRLRGACMGHVPGEVVAAAFACFNPKVVVPAVAAGWQIAGREAILEAREQGATGVLRRVLGDEPAGLARVTDLLRQPPASTVGEPPGLQRAAGRSGSPTDGDHVAHAVRRRRWPPSKGDHHLLHAVRRPFDHQLEVASVRKRSCPVLGQCLAHGA